MPILSIDIETYSDVDLTKCGVYAYSDSPNFEILLFAYAFHEEPTQIVDFACGEDHIWGGRCGFFLAAFSRPASACPSDRVSRGVFYCSERGGLV